MEFSKQEYWSGVPLPSPIGVPTHRLVPTELSGPLFNALYATVLDSMAVMEFSFLILILIEYSQRNTEVFLPIGMLFYDILTFKQLLS